NGASNDRARGGCRSGNGGRQAFAAALGLARDRDRDQRGSGAKPPGSETPERGHGGSFTQKSINERARRFEIERHGASSERRIVENVSRIRQFSLPHGAQ